MKNDETVLITGKTGVGKELIARTIHDISRPEKPFAAAMLLGISPQEL